MPYLTVADYIVRFGERETTILTNSADAQGAEAPSYDSAKVDEAISDAEQVANGYIGPRYQVPIDSPPRLVKGWVAALAREALYVNGGRVPDAIRDAADRVRAQLKDVQAGRMDLPIAPGDPAPINVGGGDAMSSGDRECPVFSNGRIDDYTRALAPSAYLPNWRQGQ